MKLKFTIEYGTQWGESVHVVLCYKSQDGTERRQNQPMLTQDGQTWAVETAVIESRQHPVTAVTYHYQIEDGDGRIIRKEWSLVPRTYWFDPSKNYVFNDKWRDMPLCAHLYTDAYLTTQHQPHGEQVEARRLPLYRKTVIFRVSAPQLLAGQSLALIGSHPMLGAWSTARYLRMEYIGQGDWTLSVNMDSLQLPVEYKYVVVDNRTYELVAWEEGDNRVVDVELADGEVRILHGDLLRLPEKTWRAAGVVVPLFALRSEHSYGVGDFGDLRRFVDWAEATGMKMIQLLPVNDTTTDGRWHDSYPYNIVSCFALHPHYLDLEQLGEVKKPQSMTVFRRRQRELNELPYSDYEAVERVKSDYISEAFAEYGEKLLSTDGFKDWFCHNEYWLEPYAEWLKAQRPDHSGNVRMTYYIQYNLHLQLDEASRYARSKGIALKGDMPVGVNRHSVETHCHPELFHMDCSAGTCPDNTSMDGQNWGFPTYNWNHTKALNQWFHRRYRWMEQYFDAVRIDHVLGYFRVWEVPAHAVSGLLGHFSPSLPLTAGEIEHFGLPFRKEMLTRPFINDRVLERLFGVHVQYVRDTFLTKKAYGLYDLKAEFDTQRKVADSFGGRTDENSLWIRDGLLRLIANVLFVEDPCQEGMYHPRVNACQETVFQMLSAEEQDAYMRLYNNYFFQRHSMFWGHEAMHHLGATLSATRMLVCAEDLGMLPDCVAPVLDALRILTLEVQTMPKANGYEFSHLGSFPYRSVCTIATHDMPPLRLWWEESPERTQRYYVTMLQKQGRAPESLPAHIAEEIVARHLYCPSMLCLLSLQDWLSIDAELRRKKPREERVNVPGDSYNRWQYRMHVTIEQLIGAQRLNSKLKNMILRSRR